MESELSTSPANRAGPSFETWSRYTIMSGEVVTYAQGFEGEGVFPYPKQALGCFEISASRNALMVHRAEINDAEDLSAFQAAMEAAWEKRRELSRNR